MESAQQLREAVIRSMHRKNKNVEREEGELSSEDDPDHDKSPRMHLHQSNNKHKRAPTAHNTTSRLLMASISAPKHVRTPSPTTNKTERMRQSSHTDDFDYLLQKHTTRKKFDLPYLRMDREVTELSSTLTSSAPSVFNSHHSRYIFRPQHQMPSIHILVGRVT
jgi:hypothetical protein